MERRREEEEMVWRDAHGCAWVRCSSLLWPSLQGGEAWTLLLRPEGSDGGDEDERGARGSVSDNQDGSYEVCLPYQEGACHMRKVPAT